MMRRKEYIVKVDEDYLKKAMSKYTADVKEQIMKALEEMKYYPPFPGIKPIKGHKGMYRKKVGDIRILYIKQKREMLIFKIAHRKESYRGL